MTEPRPYEPSGPCALGRASCPRLPGAPKTAGPAPPAGPTRGKDAAPRAQTSTASSLPQRVSFEAQHTDHVVPPQSEGALHAPHAFFGADFVQ